MKYYIDLDMWGKRILVSETTPSDHPFYVVFDQRYKADNFLKKINAGLIKSPIIDKKNYELVSEENNSLGTVYYYKYLGEWWKF